MCDWLNECVCCLRVFYCSWAALFFFFLMIAIWKRQMKNTPGFFPNLMKHPVALRVKKNKESVNRHKSRFTSAVCLPTEPGLLKLCCLWMVILFPARLLCNKPFLTTRHSSILVRLFFCQCGSDTFFVSLLLCVWVRESPVQVPDPLGFKLAFV